MSVFDRACHLALLCLPLISNVCGQTYTVTDLGTLPGGGFSSAESINAAGHITGLAGTANGDTHPVFWTPGAGMIDIAGSAIPSGGNVQGFSINNNDHIVGSPNLGFFEQGFEQGFFYNGTFSYLQGALQSSAFGINDSDQIAGVILGDGLARAAVWTTPAALPLDISVIVAGACGTSPTGNSSAGHINNGGLVTGYSSSTPGSLVSEDKYAFLYNNANIGAASDHLIKEDFERF